MADDVTPKSDGPDKDSELTTAKNEVEGTPTAAESVPSDPPASGPADGGLAARPDGPAKKTNIKIGSKREGIKAQPQTLTPGHDVLQVSSKLDISEQTQEQKNYPPPRLDSKITPEVQREIDAALGDMSLDQLMESTVAGEELNEGDKTSGRVHSVRSDDIFVDLGRRNQGVVSVKYFSEVPEVGSMIDVVVNRFDVAEGIYELVVPDAAVDISDWSELSQGMVVEATVTGHNKGGLEVAVNKLKGFIPISQVTLYRVEELEEFVGQK
ncbi:MAG: S1 RNA-binding domain-containing protein, partial [Planctomycetales bacterium]